MTIYRGVTGINREIKEQYRGVGGVNREIKEQCRGLGGANKKVFESKVNLYNCGNEYTAVTGGWREGYVYAVRGTLAKNLDNIYLHVYNGSDIYAETALPLDLQNYNYIKAAVNITSTGDKAKLVLAITSGPKRSFSSFIASQNYWSTNGEISLPIASYTGLYYIVLQGSSSTTQTSSCAATIKKIWLE
ncbi:hypothetical protein FRZ06_10005 [Anoxybacterium hadale]|uniref:Uncharacterized protein n=1 Tax=Anoxybacterium hadale TaxID=3408580 RepID=A0ACD1ABX9_9FIRM|nr:hypothetical protein FRZ06_10005 [Clostridiales bacterium]